MTTKYSFVKGLLKAIVAFILFAIPVVLQSGQEQYLNLTVGAILVMVFNGLKFWYNQNFL